MIVFQFTSFLFPTSFWFTSQNKTKSIKRYFVSQRSSVQFWSFKIFKKLNSYFKMACNNYKKKMAQVVWGHEEYENRMSAIVQDSTWSMNFETRICDVDFKFIAGNRDTFLSGEPENNGKKISQLAMRKKYR